MATVGQITEKNLRRQITEGLDSARENDYSLQLLNREENEIDIELVEMSDVIGASISRDNNHQMGLQHLRFGASMLPYVKIFFPTNLLNSEGMGVNIELILKIESNLKLNLVGKDQEPLSTDPDSKEVHFMQMEAQLVKIDQKQMLNPKAFYQFNKDLHKVDELDGASDWTITDFDFCLNGNPHTSG